MAGALLGETVEASDWDRSLLGVVLVEAFAVRTAALLDNDGVRLRLTNDALSVHLDYGERLAERTFGDVDLVIDPDDSTVTLDALGAAGLCRPAAGAAAAVRPAVR